MESKNAEEVGKKCQKDLTAKDNGSLSSKSLSGRKSAACNKAFHLLESQGIIVGKTLGSGSYAKVKSAYDINRKHKVAIKIIIKKKAFDEYLDKFLPREIDAMKTLSNHYALVKFYQIIETTSRYFFIMEMAENGDLLTVIKSKKNIPEDDAGIWFVNLYEGLKYMHGKGFVHRDIKCENLVIDNNNALKITDFGFAKKIGKAKGGGPLLSETYCGSYAYAPPEILKGTPYDPAAADVWSMGVVLFTMVYGRLPFDDSDHKKLLKQVEKKVHFPCKPDVTKKCRILIVKILSKASERIPLKNIKSDPWFQDQKALQMLEKNTDSADDVTNGDTKTAKHGLSITDNTEEKMKQNISLDIPKEVSNQQGLKVHSVTSHEDLKCDNCDENEDNFDVKDNKSKHLKVN